MVDRAVLVALAIVVPLLTTLSAAVQAVVPLVTLFFTSVPLPKLVPRKVDHRA